MLSLSGDAPAVVQQREANNVVDLMAALKGSIEAEGESQSAGEPTAKAKTKSLKMPKKPGMAKAGASGKKKQASSA